MADQVGTLSGIIDRIRRSSAMTRPALARTTDLGRAIVTQRVDLGISAGILVEENAEISTGGRPSRVLGVNSTAGTILAAVFGAGILHVALSDLRGRPLRDRFLQWDIARGPETSLSAMLAVADELAADADLPPLWAAVVGVPGPVDFPAGRAVAPPIMPGWDGFPVRAWVQDQLNVPTWVDNDANLMALGAWSQTRSAAGDDVILVKAGTGVGAGLVLGGRLHRGIRGAAGDFGHIPVADPSSVRCRCGRFGCLEAYAGGWALVRDASEAATNRRNAFLYDLRRRNGEITIFDVVDGVEQGDPLCTELVLRSARLVGETLAALVSMLNPSTVFLAGHLARVGEPYVAAVREAVQRRALDLALDDLVIAALALNHYEGAYGAAELALDGIFSPAMLSRWIDDGSPRGHLVEATPPSTDRTEAHHRLEEMSAHAADARNGLMRDLVTTTKDTA